MMLGLLFGSTILALVTKPFCNYLLGFILLDWRFFLWLASFVGVICFDGLSFVGSHFFHAFVFFHFCLK